MTSDHLLEEEPGTATGFVSVRGALRLGALSVAALAVYGLLVLVPYFLNDLHRLPLAEVGGGGYDPKDMWPTTIPLIGGWLHTGGLLSGLFVPTVTWVVLVASGVASAWAVLHKAWSAALAHAVVCSLCVTGTIWFSGPVAQTLVTWQLD